MNSPGEDHPLNFPDPKFDSKMAGYNLDINDLHNNPVQLRDQRLHSEEEAPSRVINDIDDEKQMEFFDNLRHQQQENTINVTQSVKEGDIIGIDERQLNSLIEKSNHYRASDEECN